MADSPTPPGTVRVQDAQALRALAHPLRLRLLALLRLEGPSTATLLGQRLGESSGATSYHLRSLARYGYVAEVPGRGTGRERWWQAEHRATSWDDGDFADEGSEVVDELQRRVVEQRGRLLGAWLAQRDALPQEWDGAASLNDYALRLTPEQARALVAELHAVVERWADDHHASQPVEGGTQVSLVVDLVPLAEWPL